MGYVNIARKGRAIGSWPLELLPSMLNRGDVRPDDTWRVQGMADWMPVRDLHLLLAEDGDTIPAAAKRSFRPDHLLRRQLIIQTMPAASPAAAALLNCLLPGIGYLYLGRDHLLRGFAVLLAYLLTVSLAGAVLAATSGSLATLKSPRGAAFVVAVLLLITGSAIDAARMALRDRARAADRLVRREGPAA
jgi:hypothetical protein